MAPTPTIHLFEPSGYAGVFQHTCRLALALSERGHPVTLHTGHQHERVTLDSVTVCGCVWWPMPSASSRAATLARKAAIARRFVAQTVPHLRRAVTCNAVLHVQGVAATGGLNLLLFAAARRAGVRVVYSPHDVFSRRGFADGVLLRIGYRVPHAVIVHSQADARRLGNIGVHAVVSPLIQLVPTPTEPQRRAWRREWRADDADSVVLFAGFIRPEKRVDVIVESARTWPPGRRLAVVGPTAAGGRGVTTWRGPMP